MRVDWGVTHGPVLDDRYLGAVLAGGESRRFGAPKPRVRIDGRSMAERAVTTLRAVCREVVAISTDGTAFEGLDVPLIPDAHPGIGPLGGVHAALVHARENELQGALVLAVDLPFMPRQALRILQIRADSSSAEVIALEGQPLCALYRLAALPRIEARIDAGDHAMQGLLETLPHDTVRNGELRAAGIPERALLNVNRPDDLPDDTHFALP